MRTRGHFLPTDGSCQVLFCIGLSVLAMLATNVAATELPPGFRLEPFADGLSAPSDLADTPDGLILITERTTGDVRMLRHGRLQAAPYCSVTVGAAGLQGIAVHPEHQSNGWVYLYYSDAGSGSNKVTRWERDGYGCANPVDIIDLGAGATRTGGGLGFGTDGKLYVAVGDMGIDGNGQDPDAVQGKVLRLNDDGSIPADNPNPASAVYTVGLRDPKSVHVTDSGVVFATDAGMNSIPIGDPDELNIATAGGNLGWAVESGSGGVFDDPLLEWLPTVGIHGVVDYDGALFPDAATDGKDNDHDSFGPDGSAGVHRVDDNGMGECIGGVNNGSVCANVIACLPARGGENTPICEFRDDVAEYCPGGSPLGDDDCDNAGTAGIDEADESYVNDVFAVGQNTIRRGVMTGANSDQLLDSKVFFDGSAHADCPTNLTGIMSGRDGHLYVLAESGGVGGGALYRIVHDQTAGPREVSGPKSYVQLLVDKAGADVEISWEDLRKDSVQVQNNTIVPLAPEPRYTIWRGALGDFTSHVDVANGITGTSVNNAVRSATVAVEPSESHYFLVSGRGNNLEGTLGSGDDGERTGFADTDLCDNLGFFQAPTWDLFTCARNISLTNEYGEPRNLTDLRGQPVWLDFPAEWCGPCLTQANEMETIYLDYRDRNIGAVALSILHDEEVNGQDWDGRPNQAECRAWADRPGNLPDHTFECWPDPTNCPGSPGACAGATQEGYPKFNAFGALPTNAIVDQDGRVVWADAGWSQEGTVRARLNNLLGPDSCLQ